MSDADDRRAPRRSGAGRAAVPRRAHRPPRRTPASCAGRGRAARPIGPAALAGARDPRRHRRQPAHRPRRPLRGRSAARTSTATTSSSGAADAGAVAAIVEQPLTDVGLPQVVVDRSPAALADAAAWWYGDPSHELGVVGITGTDGKTTTSFLAVAALEAAGLSTGLLGTVETKIGASREPNPEHTTTPGAPELQRALRAMVGAGNAAAVVETTSHGLAADRVRGIAYDVAILTNLTHEHLEFHGTWEAYRDAKLSLFERLAVSERNPRKATPAPAWPKVAVVNVDDPSAGLFVGVAQEAGARIVTYGTDPAADVRATHSEEDARGLRVAYDAPSGAGRLELRLAGRFNVHNALAVVALGEGLGLDPAAVRAGLESVEGVPGRMERVDAGQPFGVVDRLRPQPGLARGGPRAPRAGRGGARRRR